MIFRVYTLCSLLLAANIRCFLPTSPSWSYSPSLLLVCACNTEVYTTKQNVALVAGRLAECHWDNMESSSTAAPIMRTLSLMFFFRSISASNFMASGGQSLLDWTSRRQLRSLEPGRLLRRFPWRSAQAHFTCYARERIYWFDSLNIEDGRPSILSF